MHRTKHQIVSNVHMTTKNCTYILSLQSQLRIEQQWIVCIEQQFACIFRVLAIKCTCILSLQPQLGI